MNENANPQSQATESIPPAERTYTADEVRHLLGDMLAAQEIGIVGVICEHGMCEHIAASLFDCLRSGLSAVDRRAKELNLSGPSPRDEPKLTIHRAVRAFEDQIREDPWNAEIEGSGGW